jgi:GNAT superfamily N-acetyltransferase
MSKRASVRGIKKPASPIRILSHDELPLLRDHLLRLDPTSRRDRFHGSVGDVFIDNYIARCFGPETIAIAYLENDEVHGVAELHEPASDDDLPELAFSVEQNFRRRGVGSILFKTLLDEARPRATGVCASPPAYRTMRCVRWRGNSARISCSITASLPAPSI